MSPAPLLEIRGLVKRFGAVTVAEAVDLDIAPGEVHALIGPNGAGKSSLIGQIAGEIRPDAGRIRFLGADLEGRSPAARSQAGIGRSFQMSSLFEQMSVLENALLAAQRAHGTGFGFVRRALDRAEPRARAEATLAQVGLAGRAAEPVASLAHGEKRQLEIALALAGAPRLLLLDEPLAGQAAGDAEATVALLDRLRPAHAMLLVEHDMDAVFALADRITVMVDGRVIASGRPETIRADPGVRDAYLGDA
ncbi:MAG TPA: ABC transporter ATP-binding protein [Geminicoccaceae bacterium]